MTKEQEEAIRYLEKHINYFKEQIKFIEEIDCDYYDEEYELYKNRVKQFETVLNILKEKDKEIKKLKKHNEELLRKLRNRVKEVKKLNKYSLYKKEFKTLNEQLKNKDKIIDLIINEFYKRSKISENCYIQKSKGIEDCLKHKNCKECIKQYFKSKAEKE